MSDALPLAYFITYTCYGTRLHGDENGSVDDRHNRFDTPFLPASGVRNEVATDMMSQERFIMDQPCRQIVLSAMRGVCEFRRWELLAAHVRSTHIHAVVQANADPEKIMNDFKSYSSRHLNQAGLDSAERKRWTRHGSTKYLWKPEEVEEKVHYTLFEQGDFMEVYPQQSSNQSLAR